MSDIFKSWNNVITNKVNPLIPRQTVSNSLNNSNWATTNLAGSTDSANNQIIAPETWGVPKTAETPKTLHNTTESVAPSGYNSDPNTYPEVIAAKKKMDDFYVQLAPLQEIIKNASTRPKLEIIARGFPSEQAAAYKKAKNDSELAYNTMESNYISAKRSYEDALAYAKNTTLPQNKADYEFNTETSGNLAAAKKSWDTLSVNAPEQYKIQAWAALPKEYQDELIAKAKESAGKAGEAGSPEFLKLPKTVQDTMLDYSTKPGSIITTTPGFGDKPVEEIHPTDFSKFNPNISLYTLNTYLDGINYDPTTPIAIGGETHTVKEWKDYRAYKQGVIQGDSENLTKWKTSETSLTEPERLTLWNKLTPEEQGKVIELEKNWTDWTSLPSNATIAQKGLIWAKLTPAQQIEAGRLIKEKEQRDSLYQGKIDTFTPELQDVAKTYQAGGKPSQDQILKMLTKSLFTPEEITRMFGPNATMTWAQLQKAIDSGYITQDKIDKLISDNFGNQADVAKDLSESIISSLSGLTATDLNAATIDFESTNQSYESAVGYANKINEVGMQLLGEYLAITPPTLDTEEAEANYNNFMTGEDSPITSIIQQIQAGPYTADTVDENGTIIPGTITAADTAAAMSLGLTNEQYAALKQKKTDYTNGIYDLPELPVLQKNRRIQVANYEQNARKLYEGIASETASGNASIYASLSKADEIAGQIASFDATQAVEVYNAQVSQLDKEMLSLDSQLKTGQTTFSDYIEKRETGLNNALNGYLAQGQAMFNDMNFKIEKNKQDLEQYKLVGDHVLAAQTLLQGITADYLLNIKGMYETQLQPAIDAWQAKLAQDALDNAADAQAGTDSANNTKGVLEGLGLVATIIKIMAGVP